MTANQFIGDNYELNENSNGDLEIVDSNNGQTVLTHDNSTQTWQFGVDTDLENNDVTGVGALEADSVNTDQTQTKTIASGDHYYTGDYDGADADARLDAALSDAIADNGRKLIYLESEVNYSDDRTLDNFNTLAGLSQFATSTAITGTWTIENQCSVENVRMTTGEIVVNDAETHIKDCQQLDVTINANDVLVTGCIGGSVTFASGTSGGDVAASISVSVTDNGSNI